MATIKKGSYRFNDVLTFVRTFEVSLPFSIPAIVIDETTMSVSVSTSLANYQTFIVIDDMYTDNGKEWALTYDGSTDGTGTSTNPYTQSDGWNAFSSVFTEIGFTVSADVSGYGQTITVTEDFIPSNADEEAFATWFEANTEPVGNTPAVEITYKGETISLNSGETVTLHTTEKKLTEDLVIKANEVGGSYEEYNGEVVIS